MSDPQRPKAPRSYEDTPEPYTGETIALPRQDANQRRASQSPEEQASQRPPQRPPVHPQQLPVQQPQQRAGSARPQQRPTPARPQQRPARPQYQQGTTRPQPRSSSARPSARAARPAPRRIWPIVRNVLLGIVVLFLIGLGVAYWQVRGVAQKIVVSDARLAPPFSAPLIGFNVLLVGVDARPDHPEEGVRGDSLMLIHLDPMGRWVSTLSIPRDTQVELRDVGTTKINVAYGQGYARAEELYGAGTTPEQGGMAMAAETVEQFLELPNHGQRIDYVATINFDGFAAIIDALGGVTIDVPKHIVDDAYPTPDFGTMRVEFLPGPEHMNGERALIYARTRHADDDFGRAARQQQVIRAILDEIRNRNLIGKLAVLPKLRDSLDGSVATTMPIARLDTMSALLVLASGLDTNAIQQTRLSPETAPNVMEIGSNLVWDRNDVRAVVDSFLQRPSEAAEQATVQVLNATDIGGLAGSVSVDLERAGFTLLVAGNAPQTNPDKTIVYNLRNKPRTSQRLADMLGATVQSGPLPEGAESDADIVVILGRDAGR
jgi:LCP family protein required for cell wall assembly